MTDITELTAEKLEEIRQRYRPTLAPKCHICGVEMTIQRMSASRITYGCAGAIYDETGCHYAEGRSLADDHYAESRITVVDVSDPDVFAMVEALEKAQAGEKQWREVVDAFCTDDADWHNLTNSNNELIALLSQALCEQADRIAELEPFRTAYMEWGDKTDWVQTDKRFGVVKPLGKHRADVLKEYIQHLESRTVKLTRAVSKGGQGYQEQVERILTAAGIKWEAE